MQWKRDEEIERQLDELGMEWEYRTMVPVSRIDIEQSKKNNARFKDTIDDDRCKEYAGFMENGSIFEAVVLAKSNLVNKGFRKDKFFVLAGNNRLHSAQKIAVTQVSAYVVKEAAKSAIDIFIRTDNMKHGRGYTEEERMTQILGLHTKHRLPLMDLCKKAFGKRYNTIYNRLCDRRRGQTVKRELARNGADPSRLKRTEDTPSIFEELYKLSPNDKSSKLGNTKLLRKAFLNVHDCDMNLTEVKGMVKEVRKCKTEKEQMEVLGRIEKTSSKRLPQRTRSEFETLHRKITALHEMLTTGNDGESFKTFKELGSPSKDRINTCLCKMQDICVSFTSLKAGHRIKRPKKRK